MIGPTIIPPIAGIISIQYQEVFIIFSRMLPSPWKEIADISLIKNLIPIAEKPASTPMIIATIIIKVCSVSLSLSKWAAVRRENLFREFVKKLFFTLYKIIQSSSIIKLISLIILEELFCITFYNFCDMGVANYTIRFASLWKHYTIKHWSVHSSWNITGAFKSSDFSIILIFLLKLKSF